MKYRVFNFSLDYDEKIQGEKVKKGLESLQRMGRGSTPFFFTEMKREEVNTSFGKKTKLSGLVEVPEGVSHYSFVFAFDGLHFQCKDEIGKSSHVLPRELFPYDWDKTWERDGEKCHNDHT